MHQRLFIFLPKIVNMWSMETTNKGKIVGIGKIGMNSSISKEDALNIDDLKNSLLSIHQLCDKDHLSKKRILMFVYFFYYFCLWLLIFWLSFDACFLLEFWLSLIIMFDSYDDCIWELCWLSLMIVFLLSFFLAMMIVFKSYVDCLWWLILMIVFEGYVDYWLLLMIFFLIIYFEFFILDMYFCGCKIVFLMPFGINWLSYIATSGNIFSFRPWNDTCTVRHSLLF